MRKNLGAKPFLYPQPVLIIAAYDKEGIPNAMNVAWGAMCDVNKIALCISRGHKTTKNIFESRAFTVSTATATHVTACDYVGLVLGNKVEGKFTKAGFHAMKSEFVNAPIIKELPLTLECRLDSYNEDVGMLIGEIVNVSADECILDQKGNVDIDKYLPIVVDPIKNNYLQLGNKVGDAFSEGRILMK